MSFIGLCMIVKDEAALILRCLQSVEPLLDYVLICDTGSTDGTQTLIKDWLDNNHMPGAVVEETWQDFAHNRSSALAHLRTIEWIDYALMIDADDQLVFDEGFDPETFKSSLQHGLYDVAVVLGRLHYPRAQLLSNRLEFRYRGVIHEYVEGPLGEITGNATGFHIVAGVEGCRSRNPDKYRDDAALLAKAYADERDPFVRARYAFYVAQSWKDAGEREAALSWYLHRAEMPAGVHQEIFVSRYRAAELKEQLGCPSQEVIGSYLWAYEADPNRAEALHGAVRYCHWHGLHHQGYLLGKHGLTLSEPANRLFAEPWIYQYGMFDDFAIAACGSGHYQDCVDICTQLLAEGRVPEHEVPRITANRQFAERALSMAS